MKSRKLVITGGVLKLMTGTKYTLWEPELEATVTDDMGGSGTVCHGHSTIQDSFGSVQGKVGGQKPKNPKGVHACKRMSVFHPGLQMERCGREGGTRVSRS